MTHDKATAAYQRAVREAIKEANRKGIPGYARVNGKIVEIWLTGRRNG